MRFLRFLPLCLALWACDDTTSSPGTPRDGDAGPRGDAGDGAVPDGGVSEALAITTPMDGAVLAGRFVDVTGTVRPAALAVMVDGRAAAVQADGTWTLRLELESGPHTITATAGGQTATVSVTVDAEPPFIDITSPERATHSEPGQTNLEFTITDDAGLAQVIFDGDLAVDPGLGPDFGLMNLPLVVGLNILRLQAIDTAGNISNEHVSVLHGPLADPAEPVQGALRLRVGPAGIDSLEGVALDYLRQQDLTALLPDPVFDSGPFRASVTSIQFNDPPILEFTPTPGRLEVDIRLEEAVVVLSLFVNDREAYVVSAGAAAITLTGGLEPTVEGGQLVIRLFDLEIGFVDLAIEAGGVPEFEENPEEGQTLIEEIASSALALVAERFLPDLLDRLLGRIDEPIDLTLLGAQLRLNLLPEVIVVSNTGLSARVGVGIELQNPAPGAPSLPGYITTGGRWDGAPETDRIAIAVDDDLVNLLLYQVWRTGGLFPRLDGDGGGQVVLVTSLLGNLVRRANPDVDPETPIAIETALPMPPVISVAKANDAVGVTVGVGDMILAVLTDDVDNTVLLEGAASLEMTAGVGVHTNADGSLGLDLDVTETVAAFDVTTESLRGAAENSVEEPLNNLLGRVGGVLPGLLGDLPIPLLDFVVFTNLRTDVSGPDGGFITIIGDVEPPAR